MIWMQKEINISDIKEKAIKLAIDPDPEGNFIIVGVNFRILPAGTPIVTKDGSII